MRIASKQDKINNVGVIPNSRFFTFCIKNYNTGEDIVLRCKTESTYKVLMFAYLVCAEVRLIALKSKWWRVKMYRIPKTRFVRMK